MSFFAACAKGLEYLLADELQALANDPGRGPVALVGHGQADEQRQHDSAGHHRHGRHPVAERAGRECFVERFPRELFLLCRVRPTRAELRAHNLQLHAAQDAGLKARIDEE